MTTCPPWRRTWTTCPASWCGTEYWPPSNDTSDIVSALRVTPSAAVNGAAGTGCRRGSSSASISAGARRVTRCGRALTCSQNAAQAASRAAKLPYSAEQVRVRGNQVGLGHLDRGLRTALGRRVIGHAGGDRQPVVPAELHRALVADRDPGDVLDGDRLLIVGQQVGRHPAGPAQGHVERSPDRRLGLVQQRQHDPEP